MELYFGGKKMFGKSVIRQIGGNRKGSIDYRGEGEGGLYVLDGDDYVLYRACRERSPDRWTIRNAKEEIAGTLSRESAFSVKRFEYDAGERGFYLIVEDIGGYRIEGTSEAAFVDRKKHPLKSDEYWLQTDDTQDGGVSEYEWIAVIQGIEVLRGRSLRPIEAIGALFP
ncbi:hypothetical protein [Saccharibacillus deserti]|uniref:hypothetical protein n=1 Tax=Saccharibacillus deserti TaxID=1634444 RepID=UPI001552B02D|nr:hypothetical protein [Saccharibacillus deserti]